jgi:prepilin-type N-terminal cleavage/methylation domain-containing protein
MKIRISSASAPEDHDRDDDSGMTMVEVLVSLVVMSIAMLIFTSGVLVIYRTLTKVESLATVQDRITTTFQRMDRDLRYASAISDPGLETDGNYYVEYLMTIGSADRCVQLRFRPTVGELQQRTWPNNNSPGATWALLVKPVAQVAATDPFTLTAPTNTFPFQSLQVRLQAATGTGTGAASATRETNVTFAALNTNVETVSPAGCVVRP